MKWNALTYLPLFSGLGMFSYFLIINYTDFSPLMAEVLYSRGAMIYTILAFNLAGYSTLQLSEWVNRQYVTSTLRKWKSILPYLTVAFLLLFLNYGLFVTAKLLAHIEPLFYFSRSGWQLLMVVWLVEMVVISLLLSNHTLHANWQLQQETAHLQIENARAKYSALQNQLNPHFLFNSLNTLIAEIRYNPDNAVRFTQHLSTVYRYVLQCRDRDTVPLQEEITFLESYLFLHRVRLGDCIQCCYEMPDEYREQQIPPLTLQLLVENVIKHNSISMSRPMRISIRTTHEYLIVSNPVSPKKRKEPSEGIGLENLNSRCRLMTGKSITFSIDASQFTIKIPLLS